MVFYWFKSIESTQVFLLNLIKSFKDNRLPILVVSREQTNGIGSRANTWMGVKCGVYMSCALHKNMLPNDVKMQSLSIYFGCIFLPFFRTLNADIWLKWPNDFYLASGKVGGIITQIYRDYVVFGLGLNLFDAKFKAILDSIDSITYKNIIYQILEFLEFKNINFDINENSKIIESNSDIFYNFFYKYSWESIFEFYKKEYYKNHNFKAHILTENNIYKEINLKDSILQTDGSIKINNQTIHALR